MNLCLVNFFASMICTYGCKWNCNFSNRQIVILGFFPSTWVLCCHLIHVCNVASEKTFILHPIKSEKELVQCFTCFQVESEITVSWCLNNEEDCFNKVRLIHKEPEHSTEGFLGISGFSTMHKFFIYQDLALVVASQSDIWID